MIKKYFCGVAILALFSNCSEDSGTPILEIPKDVQKQLGAYVWYHITADIKDENEFANYKLLDCEMDNSYHFLFQENLNQLNFDPGTKVCKANTGRFEQIVFKKKNSSNFTFNKERGTIKFEDQDQYSSYLAVVNGDKLVLASQNNNPAANVVPVKYYFKGVKAQ
ncbi:hypothetical protein ACFX5U_01795 [Sphingobacterium sp. SG20118]|uniref:hypothetical protein n=1 Tax=Sphingobacterium sp. SG20118 TaxID=3367156 RepID=UPI0037DFC783